MPTPDPCAPLREPTDEELVARARVGDDRALDLLLPRHRALVRARARAHFLVGADQDDLLPVSYTHLTLPTILLV